MAAGSGGIDDADAQGGPDAQPRLHDAVQDRAHAQGRAPLPGGGAGRRRAFPAAAAARDALSAAVARGTARGLRGAAGGLRGLRGPSARSPKCAVCSQFGDLGRIWDNAGSPVAPIALDRRVRGGICLLLPPNSSLHYANCVQGMGGHRPRARRGRAARSPCARAGSASRRSTSSSSTTASSSTRRSTTSATTCVRESHQPELRRALEEGVWADGEPPPNALTARRRHRPARPRPDPRVGRGGRALDDRRPPHGRRAVPVLRLDPRLRREAAGVEAPPPAARRSCCARTASRGRSPSRCSDEFAGCRSWLEITRDLPFEGTPVLSDDEFDRASEQIARHRRRAASPRWSSDRGSTGRAASDTPRARPRRRHRRRRRRRRRARRRRRSPRAGRRRRRRRPHLGAPAGRPAPRPAPLDEIAGARAAERRRRARRPGDHRPRRLSLLRVACGRRPRRAHACSSTRTPARARSPPRWTTPPRSWAAT